jgi:hypothetical protein
MLSEPLFGIGRGRDPSSGEQFTARIRSPGAPDLVVDVRRDGCRLLFDDKWDLRADVECDAAARLLLVWGRRPAAAERVRTTLDPGSLVRLTTILSGY